MADSTAIVFLLGALWAGAPGEADDPRGGIASAEWLRSAMTSREGVSMVDVRDAWEYAEAHVKRAAHANPEDLVDLASSPPGTIPSADALTTLGRRLGLSNGPRPAVFYGRADQPHAARAAMIFRLFGHPRSFWLDGGMDALKRAGFEMATFADPVPHGDFTARAPASGRVDGAWVLAHLSDPDVVLVDTRSRREFEGGRIPGARWIEWTENFSAGFVRPEKELLDRYAKIGLDPRDRSRKTVVCYCAIGTRASASALVLERLGFEHVVLYDGSWVDWTRVPRPIERDPKEH
jgi:thiosulfate/3-mercaptopyruvate sulfurtransferase